MTTSLGLIDSHLHLDVEAFHEDREDVIVRAKEAGVEALVCIGTGLASTKRAIALAETHPMIFATTGTHPHQAGQTTPEEIAAMRELLEHPRVVGAGEVGLDYFYMKSPKEVQIDVFRQWIRISQETQMPLIIHTRDAEEDTLRLFREESNGEPYRGVIHCFSGSLSFAEACIEMGFYISLSGIVTFAKSLQKIVKRLPPERLLIETDAPYLAPAPHRGKRNEPAFVRDTAVKVAKVLGMELEALAEITAANTRTLFSLPTVAS